MTGPRTIPVVAPRTGELAVIAGRVAANRRRRKRRAGVAGAITAALLVVPFLLASHDGATGLRPVRPGVTRSPEPSVANAAPAAAAEAYTGGAFPTPPVPRHDAPPASTAPSCCPTHPGRTDGASGTLTITGTATAYALVRVDATTTLDLAAATADYLDRYGGFAIGSAAAFWSRDTRDDVASPAFRSAGAVVLAPGTYAVYLFTPAGSRTTVTVPWVGSSSRTVRPDTPVRSTYANSSGFAADRGSVGTGADAPKPSTVTLAMATFGPAPNGVELVGCVHLAGETCDGMPTRTTSYGSGASVRFSARLVGRRHGTYVVEVHGDATTAGALRLAVFQYDSV